MKTVVLDPGHGGKDVGAVGPSRTEAEDVLRLAQEVATLLPPSLRVVLTRERDEYVPLHSRPKRSEEEEADLFVSLHRNSHTDPNAHGTEIWVHPYAPPQDTTLAIAVLEELEQVGISTNRGVKKGSYVVLSQGPTAIMVELGFISNAQDNALFDLHFHAYAQGIARGICRFLHVPYGGEPPQEYLRVQLGAFSLQNEAGARQLIAELRDKGISAFLVVPSRERVERE